MSAIETVKRRMAVMRDGIDEAERRMKEAEQFRREADVRGLAAEGEVSSLKNRIFQLQNEIDRVNKKLEQQTAKLESAEGRTLDNDELRKDLEGKESDIDQDLITLEQTTKDAKILVAENTQKYDDAVNKLTMLETDVERAYERMITAQNKVEQLEGEAHQVNTDLKDLENKDEESSQRELSLEDKVRFLDAQVKETEQLADHAERRVGKLERLRDTLFGSIELEKKKKTAAEEDLESSMKELLEIYPETKSAEE